MKAALLNASPWVIVCSEKGAKPVAIVFLLPTPRHVYGRPTGDKGGEATDAYAERYEYNAHDEQTSCLRKVVYNVEKFFHALDFSHLRNQTTLAITCLITAGYK